MQYNIWIIMLPDATHGIANTADSDQTAQVVQSGSALFAQTCLLENYGSLWYLNKSYNIMFEIYF